MAIEPLPLTELPARPRVSMVVTSYNYARFLGECLDACLDQSTPPDEIVVVDDGSTDDTGEILSGYMARHPQVRGIRRINGGTNHAASVSTPSAAASGRSKKPSRFPSDLIIDVTKFEKVDLFV